MITFDHSPNNLSRKAVSLRMDEKLLSQPTTVLVTYRFETNKSCTEKVVKALLSKLGWIVWANVQTLTHDGNVWTLTISK